MKTLNKNKNFLAIDDEFSNLENSKIAIVSAPYEHSTSYGKGTSKGPEEILKASAYVEFYDDEFDRELCFEKGIATIQPIEFAEKKDKEAIKLIKKQVEELISRNKFVVTLGGEHTISIAPIEAHYKKREAASKQLVADPTPNKAVRQRTNHFDNPHSEVEYAFPQVGPHRHFCL